MTVISKYLTNKFILLLAIVVAIGLTPLAAADKGKSTCDYRTFNIKTNNKATAGELLSEIAEIYSAAKPQTSAQIYTGFIIT